MMQDRTVSDVAAGSSHSCAIASKRIYCWGANGSGSFGNGTSTNSMTPTPTTLANYRQIEATIGAKAATVTSRTTDSITVTSPSHTSGFKDVAITRVDDGSTAVQANAYEYLAPPTVTAVSPASGSTAGGDVVTITGQDFSTRATVKFGATSATQVTYVSRTELRATVPAAAVDGSVGVTVTNSDGQTHTLASGFTYTPAMPTIASLNMTRSKMAGGQTVTITGTNFSAAMNPTIRFGANLAAGVTVISSTKVTATVPQSSVLGSVSVSYIDKYGQTATLVDSFTYLPQSYAFINTPLVLSATEPGKLTVQARDMSGSAIVASQDITLTTTSTSATGFFARDINSGETNPWQYDSVIIKAGSSMVEFYYKDNNKNSPTLTVKDLVNTSATQTATISSRYKLQVTGVSDPVQSGVPSSITVRAINFAGQPEPSYTGTFAFSSGDTAAILPAQFTMTAEMKGVHTFVNGVTMVTPGSWCVTATDTSEASVTGSQCNIDTTTPNAGTISQLKIITSPQHIAAAEASSPITIQAQDINGVPASVSTNTSVYISTTSGTGQFSTNGVSWSSGSSFVATIPAGATATSIYYRDATLGTHELLAADRSTDTYQNDFALVNDKQFIVTGVGAPAQFAISGPSQTPVGAEQTYTVELQDGAGNAVTAQQNVSFLVNDVNASTDILEIGRAHV
jgi:hypothetical protein